VTDQNNPDSDPRQSQKTFVPATRALVGIEALFDLNGCVRDRCQFYTPL
jgi:hypothetical protein